MNTHRRVYIGTDGGATTSKVGGIWDDGTTITTNLRQQTTGAEHGPDAVVRGWVDAITRFLDENDLKWDQVSGVGLAIPGPRRSYGVLDRSPNLPDSFDGFDVHSTYSLALSEKAGRPVPLYVGNDGNMGGVAEAQRVRGGGTGSVVMLAPGSGLGGAYVDTHGLALDGDLLAGMEVGHMPAPLQVLNAKPYKCGCGRTWGCMEMYTSLAGLPDLLAEKLRDHPDHELARSSLSPKEKALSLRGLAQNGDLLAQELFDFQARAMGHLVAVLVMAVDPTFVVIGGGLMDVDATTEEFRDRYLAIIRETAEENLWPVQKTRVSIEPAALGELSQAIGAALVALYESRS